MKIFRDFSREPSSSWPTTFASFGDDWGVPDVFRTRFHEGVLSRYTRSLRCTWSSKHVLENCQTNVKRNIWRLDHDLALGNVWNICVNNLTQFWNVESESMAETFDFETFLEESLGSGRAKLHKRLIIRQSWVSVLKIYYNSHFVACWISFSESLFYSLPVQFCSVINYNCIYIYIKEFADGSWQEYRISLLRHWSIIQDIRLYFDSSGGSKEPWRFLQK